jgi:hypothetical protein
METIHLPTQVNVPRIITDYSQLSSFSPLSDPVCCAAVTRQPCFSWHVYCLCHAIILINDQLYEFTGF